MELLLEFKVNKFEFGMFFFWLDMVLDRLEVMLVFLKVKNDYFDEIILSCDVNIMRFNDIDIIVYLVFVINCMV